MLYPHEPPISQHWKKTRKSQSSLPINEACVHIWGLEPGQSTEWWRWLSLGAETMGQSGHCDQPNNENMTRIQTIYSFFRILNITLTCKHLLYLFNVFNHPSIITIKTSVYNKIYLLHRGWTNKGRHWRYCFYSLFLTQMMSP